jgi:hypothetical protein
MRVTNGPPNGIQVRLARLESDLGNIEGRTRAIEETGFRIEERFRSMTEALRDLRTEVAEMKRVEEERRAKESEIRHADRRALGVGVLGIIGTIIGATIVVVTQAPS